MSADPYELDAVVAVVDLAARSGASDFEIGYLDEDVNARWYAQARFKGALVFVDEKAGPDEAADGLARKLLAGGRCTGCNRTVTLNEPDLRRECRWRRMADAWVRGCDGKSRATKNE